MRHRSIRFHARERSASKPRRSCCRDGRPGAARLSGKGREFERARGGIAQVKVRGIETSCDETAVALYEAGRGLLAQQIYSQVALHAPYGGVVPELASRDHLRKLLPMLRKILDDGA